jgi:hypothetical protein
MKVIMHFSRSTKNTHLYKVADAEEQSAPITSVYVRKTALEPQPPASLVVEFTVLEDAKVL